MLVTVRMSFENEIGNEPAMTIREFAELYNFAASAFPNVLTTSSSFDIACYCCSREVLQQVEQSQRQSSRLRGAKRLSGGPKFETKHKSRCLQKSKLNDWVATGQACRLGGQAPT